MGEGQPVLRSKDPVGVEQEMWALFAVYQADPHRPTAQGTQLSHPTAAPRSGE